MGSIQPAHRIVAAWHNHTFKQDVRDQDAACLPACLATTNHAEGRSDLCPQGLQAKGMVLLHPCRCCYRQSAEAPRLQQQQQQQQGEASSQPSMEATISAEKRARRAAEEDAAKLLNRVKQLQKEEDKAKRRIHETRRKAQDVLRCLACVVCQSTSTGEPQHLPAALLATCGPVSAPCAEQQHRWLLATVP